MQTRDGWTRRDWLRVAGLGAAGVGLGGLSAVGQPARAQATERVSALYTLPIGDLELTIIQEGTVMLQPASFGLNAPAAAAADLLMENNLPSDRIKVTINTALLQTGDRIVLLDVGGGSLPFAAFDTDRLLPTLALLDISPDAITDVVISHFHPDHLGGLTDTSGAAVFPNAVHHISDAEYEFLTSTSGGSMRDVINIGLKALQPAVDDGRLMTFASDAEILPGLTAFPAPGHTPGHVAFSLASREEQLFAVSDVASHALLMLARPDWHVSFDVDLEQGVTTRQQILGMLADEKRRVFGYHFPFPGIGYIDRDGEGFRYLAAET
ncbi:MAG: MBL fold metallo-hydrolase [Anaerolineae bacterium]|nr:MBL fold metallo-hydrolase [Anaerolineae bacterium]